MNPLENSKEYDVKCLKFKKTIAFGDDIDNILIIDLNLSNITN